MFTRLARYENAVMPKEPKSVADIRRVGSPLYWREEVIGYIDELRTFAAALQAEVDSNYERIRNACDEAMAAQQVRADEAERDGHREVLLVWEVDPANKTQCLRSIDECEENVVAHLKMFRSEALSAGRSSARFFKEKVITNHAFGFQDMAAACIVLRGAIKEQG